jgi:hypothetical protein
MIIIIAKVIGSLIISWALSFVVTICLFYTDLNINDPEPFSKEIDFIRGRHLKMNKFVWIAIFITILFLIF